DERAGVDAVGRQADARRHHEVRRGESELAPSPVTHLHPPAHFVRAAQQRGGSDHVARLEQLADPCRRVHDATRCRFEAEADDREAELGAHALEQRDVAATAAPEVEVGADDDELRAGALDECLAREVLGRFAAAGLVEVQDETAVEQAGRGEQLELLVECGEQLRRRLRANDLRGMPVERDAHCFEVASVGELAQELQDLLVPDVHPVVDADRDRGAAVRPQLTEALDDLHHVSLGPAITTEGLHAAPRRSYTATRSSPAATSANGPSPRSPNAPGGNAMPCRAARACSASTSTRSRSRMASLIGSTKRSGSSRIWSSACASSTPNDPTDNRRSSAR